MRYPYTENAEGNALFYYKLQQRPSGSYTGYREVTFIPLRAKSKHAPAKSKIYFGSGTFGKFFKCSRYLSGSIIQDLSGSYIPVVKAGVRPAVILLFTEQLLLFRTGLLQSIPGFLFAVPQAFLFVPYPVRFN
ncbi:MAG: hypothetical protein GDA37_10010 [Ekhidna sp.]|nr:hypothetical protein [Ekhidna sp.]